MGPYQTVEIVSSDSDTNAMRDDSTHPYPATTLKAGAVCTPFASQTIFSVGGGGVGTFMQLSEIKNVWLGFSSRSGLEFQLGKSNR